jgi:nucleoid-associated protein YgaU
MRNDVKLGFAIGGVLLAVLIVYVLVVPGGTSQQKKSAQTNAISVGSSTGAGKTVTLEPVTPPAPTVGTTAPIVPAPAVADSKSATPEKTDPFASKSDTSNDTVAKAPAKGNDLDWNKLLNEQPVLMTETPVSAGSVKGHTPAPSFTPATPAPTDSSATSLAADSTAPASSAQPIPTQVAGIEPAAPAVQPVAVAPSTQPAGAHTHVVKSGETLSSISSAAYGNANFYPAILRANPGLDPTHMKPGMTINLPDAASVKPTAAQATGAQTASARVAATPLDATKEYRVQPGDNLYKIAVKLYGRGDRADKIYQANKAAIGEDPHRLRAGQVLQLPDPPATTTVAGH